MLRFDKLHIFAVRLLPKAFVTARARLQVLKIATDYYQCCTLYALAAMSGATNSAIFQRATNGDIIVIIIIIIISGLKLFLPHGT